LIESIQQQLVIGRATKRLERSMDGSALASVFEAQKLAG
jgi:hypothetical protein